MHIILLVATALQLRQPLKAAPEPEIYSVHEKWRVLRQDHGCVMQSKNYDEAGILVGYDAKTKLGSMNFIRTVAKGRDYGASVNFKVVLYGERKSVTWGTYEFIAMTVNGMSMFQQVRIEPPFLPLVARYDRIGFVRNGLIVAQFDLDGSTEAVAYLRDCADEQASSFGAEPD